MSEKKKRLSKGQIVTVAIVVVSILLIISIWLLLFVDRDSSAYAPGNYIDGVTGEVITLSDKSLSEESRFTVNNMFPGDSETKSYYVEIKTSKVKATSFHADITSDSAELKNVLLICVTADGAESPLYEGPIKDMPKSVRAEVGEEATQTVYEITVSLDVRAGNECQNKQISVDFNWWVEESDLVSPPSDGSAQPDGTGGKCCPWCFRVCPWCWIIPMLVLILIVLVAGTVTVWQLGKRRDEAQSAAIPAKKTNSAKNKNGKTRR